MNLPILPCLLFAAALSGQHMPPGYAHTARQLPSTAGNVLALPGGGLVWFDGQDLMLAPPNVAARSRLHFPLPVFGSFTLDVGGGAVLFGESSTHGLWLVPLHGARPMQALANVAFNYDAVLWTRSTAIVSAKTGGFASPDNELIAVDLLSGQTQVLARLPGASGPVALAANGDLYYATASLLFPTPPGQTTVLRFRFGSVAQALATQQVLGLAQADVVHSGLDSAADMVFDDDGDLLFVDWWNGAIGELNDAGQGSPWRTDLAGYGAVTFAASGLQFVPAAQGQAGVFEPFQPAGGTLLVHESSFGAQSQLRSVQPAAAMLAAPSTSPLPVGPFTLQASGGPSNGLGLITVALASPPQAVRIDLPGFEQPLLWQPSMFGGATHLVMFTGAGAATLVLNNPGFLPPLSVDAQAAFVDGSGVVIGVTPVHQLQLGG